MTTITQAPYLMTDLGQSTLYTMRNKNGMQVSATDFGGHLVSVLAPDRDGKLADVILGYGDYAGYKVNKYYLGAAVGRCAEPHRQGPVHPQREGVPARAQRQRRQPPARRHGRL